MCTPKESRRRLMAMIRERGEISLDDARKFSSQAGIRFGPGIDVSNVLLAKERLGIISIDRGARKVRALEV